MMEDNVMGLFTQGISKTAYSSSATFIDGIAGIPQNTPCLIFANSDLLTIQPLHMKTAPNYNIQMLQITNVAIVTEQEIVEKSKSVIGRGIAGGLLLGPVGAIVGGLSGVPSKKVKTFSFFLVFNYRSADNAEISTITFQVATAFSNPLVTYVQGKISEFQPQSTNL